MLLINTNWSSDEFTRNVSPLARRTIAQKKLRVFTIDANELSRTLGLGGHINNVMQGCFFKLSGILPLDKAIPMLKHAITESYGKLGEDVVKKNVAAVDAGVQGVQPLLYDEQAWLAAEIANTAPNLKSEPQVISDILRPITHMTADSLPVSTFLPFAGGWQPSGQTPYEKRGISPVVSSWNPSKCVQCNRCAFVCPTSSIRPIVLPDDKLENAPSCFATVPLRNVKDKRYRIQISPSDCDGCGLCVAACPTHSLSLAPAASSVCEKANWDFAMKQSENETIVPSTIKATSVQGTQIKKPLLEFAGSCPGCSQPPYMKLLTQLFGDRLFIANGIGCSVVWGGTAWLSPYTVGSNGRGPTWASSLFENTAEFGLGMALSLKSRRSALRSIVQQILKLDISLDSELRTTLEKWLISWADADSSSKCYEVMVPLLNKHQHLHPLLKRAFECKSLFLKTSHWVVGGDGWAYDIGFGGLDHILASGEKVNILVFDNENYANTGGQSSKATPLGAIAKLASIGKSGHKKDLAQMAIRYGNVYVASICYGADMQQTINALSEADAYPGVSIVFCYCPCIEHNIRGGMQNSLQQMRSAVGSGYWPLYRYDPRRTKLGKPALILDSNPSPSTDSLASFCEREARFTINSSFPKDEMLNHIKARMESLRADASGNNK